jgi:hypothetical protein
VERLLRVLERTSDPVRRCKTHAPADVGDDSFAPSGPQQAPRRWQILSSGALTETQTDLEEYRDALHRRRPGHRSMGEKRPCQARALPSLAPFQRPLPNLKRGRRHRTAEGPPPCSKNPEARSSVTSGFGSVAGVPVSGFRLRQGPCRGVQAARCGLSAWSPQTRAALDARVPTQTVTRSRRPTTDRLRDYAVHGAPLFAQAAPSRTQVGRGCRHLAPRPVRAPSTWARLDAEPTPDAARGVVTIVGSAEPATGDTARGSARGRYRRGSRKDADVQ